MRQVLGTLRRIAFSQDNNTRESDQWGLSPVDEYKVHMTRQNGCEHGFQPDPGDVRGD